MLLFDLLKVFDIYVPIESDGVYVIVSLIISGIFYWRNQDWTPAMAAATAKGRKAKQLLKKGDATLYDELVGDSDVD